jgi:hypothetical protein
MLPYNALFLHLIPDLSSTILSLSLLRFSVLLFATTKRVTPGGWETIRHGARLALPRHTCAWRVADRPRDCDGRTEERMVTGKTWRELGTFFRRVKRMHTVITRGYGGKGSGLMNSAYVKWICASILLSRCLFAKAFLDNAMLIRRTRDEKRDSRARTLET